MKSLTRGIAATMLVGTLATPAMAESMLPGEFSGNVALTNNYMFRGVSQTADDAAIQGGLDWDSGMGIYIGTWASNIDFGPGGGTMEWDIYGGYAGSIDAFSYDVGVIGYLYPGAASILNYDYLEAYLNLGYDFGPASVSAGLAWSPDWTGGLDDAYYFSGGIAVPIMEGLSIDANIGYSDFHSTSGLVDYVDYNVGIAYEFEWFTTDLRFTDTDLPGCTSLCDEKFVVTISRSF